VYVSLYQTHIPKLTDVGLVEYDQDSGTVHLTDRTSVIDDYLTDSDSSIPWHYLYLGLSAVGALAFVLAWLEVGLFRAIPLLAVGGLLVASFLVLSVAHYVSTARQHIEMPPGDRWFPSARTNARLLSTRKHRNDEMTKHDTLRTTGRRPTDSRCPRSSERASVRRCCRGGSRY